MAVTVIMEPGWQEKMRPGTEKFMDKIADGISRAATIMAPVDTGALKASIKVHTIVTPGGGLRIGRRIRAHVNYSAYVELGTTSHTITPRIKKALWWEGAKHPMSIVRHPGTRPRPFLRPAMYFIRAQYNA